MSVLTRIRSVLTPLAIVMAIVAFAVPTYTMVGCDMDMGAMRFHPMRGFHFTAPCSGTWVLRSAPAATIPTSNAPLMLTLLAALAAAVLLLAPQVTARPVLARVSNPPPPPDDPLGARFRV